MDLELIYSYRSKGNRQSDQYRRLLHYLWHGQENWNQQPIFLLWFKASLAALCLINKEDKHLICTKL